jgi:type I restriction enzyme R subunit
VPIIGEQNEKEFIRTFGAFLKVRNILTAFEAFEGKGILSERELQDWKGPLYSIFRQ